MKIFHLTIFIALSFSVLSGCQVVSVKQQAVSTTLSNERENILTRKKLSEASLNVLSMTGHESQQCLEKPNECLENLQKIPEIIDEQILSTGSEIYLAYAIRLSQSGECNPSSITQKFKNEEEKELTTKNFNQCMLAQLEALNQSLRFSYAYLFALNQPPQERLFNNRQVQVRDFYNQAIANIINAHNAYAKPSTNQFKQEVDIGTSTYLIDISEYPNLEHTKVEQLLSTYNLAFSGLRSISRRDGFGSEFVIQLKQPESKKFSTYQTDPLATYQTIQDHPNIHDATFLPATLIIEPKQKSSVEEILNSKELIVRVIDPNLHNKAAIAKQNYPVAANFSAPYGLWLANNNLGASAYWTLIDRDESLIMPHLFMLEPYQPKKKVVIMIHGLASSPEAWIAATNDIMGDAVLREHFQVWQVFYSTNMPILESRYQIYALLEQAFTDLEQQYPKQPVRNAVLLGHSMGGVITRLLLSNEDFSSKIIEHLEADQFNKYRHTKDLAPAQQRFKMKALTPEVNRAIFVSAPLQGTDFADRWFTLLARKIIKLPAGFLTASSNVLRGDIGEAADTVKKISKAFLQNGPSDLSKKSAFMQITKQAKIVPNIKYHVIIGNSTAFDDTKLMTDGIVPYASSHLPQAQSEKIINGGHSIQYSPEAVLELRRILREHLNQLGYKSP